MITQELTDTELLAHLGKIHKDEMTMFVMAEGSFRGAFFNGTRLVNQMRAQHNLGILETLVLGQAMLCAALLIPTMKGRERHERSRRRFFGRSRLNRLCARIFAPGQNPD